MTTRTSPSRVMDAPPVEASTPRSTLARRRRRDEATAWLFLLPGLTGFTIFVLGPAVGALALSFFNWSLFDTPTFVGLDQFSRLLTDPDMWKSLWVTTMFVLMGVVPTILIGFVLAVVASTTLPGTAPLRVLFFTPMVASSAVASVLWSSIYNGRDGIINQTLRLVGINGPSWLTDPVLARPALVVVMIWSALPVVIILYIAAIQRVPDDIYAAAALDGAGKWRQLWGMTWPNVRPTTLVILVLMVLTFLGSPLEYALLMTDGGPLNETTSLGLYAFRMAFERFDMGYACALALWQLIVVGLALAVGRGIKLVWEKVR